jgi:hypothetical protein
MHPVLSKVHSKTRGHTLPPPYISDLEESENPAGHVKKQKINLVAVFISPAENTKNYGGNIERPKLAQESELMNERLDSRSEPLGAYGRMHLVFTKLIDPEETHEGQQRPVRIFWTIP